MYKTILFSLLLVQAAVANASDVRGEAEFQRCAERASSLEGKIAEYERRSGLYSTGYSSYNGADIRREEKELERTISAFHRDCEQPVFNMPEEKIRSYCAHPAYQSRWCDALRRM